MTLAEATRIARHPDRFRVDVVRTAEQFWRQRADAAPPFYGREARALADLCRDSIAARQPTTQR